MSAARTDGRSPAILLLLSLTAFVSLVYHPWAAHAQGLLTLSTSIDGNVVTVDVTIEDNGGAADCGGFHLIRGTVFGQEPGVETRCIPREIGTTATHQFVDVLPADRAYYYRVVGMWCVGPCACPYPSDPDAFNTAFGSPWGLGFTAYVNTGPAEQTPVALGEIVATPGRYPPRFVEGCPGLGSWGATTSPDAEDYVDTGETVLIFGAPFFDVQNGPLLQIARVVPWSCDTPVALDQRTWGKIKEFYRE